MERRKKAGGQSNDSSAAMYRPAVYLMLKLVHLYDQYVALVAEEAAKKAAKAAAVALSKAAAAVTAADIGDDDVDE